MRRTERVFDDVELLGTLVLLIIQPLKVFFLRGDLLFLPTGCPKKKRDLRLNAHKTPCKSTRDKSRVSFRKFRKFPFKGAQEHLLFGKK